MKNGLNLTELGVSPRANFSCFAMHTRVSSKLTEPVMVEQGLIALFRTPFKVDKLWTESLGTFHDEKLADSRLLLIAFSEETSKPELDSRVSALWYGLLVQGRAHSVDGLKLSGHNTDDGLHISSGGSLDDFYLSPVVKPDIGRTTSQFIHRGQFFAGRSEVDRVLLREIFEMRSASEHLNSLKDLLDEPNPHDREKQIALRVFQSEILAGAIYRHLLTDADLLRSFRDDEGISMVWGKRDDELVRMWGAPLDLEKSVEWKFDMYLSRRGTG